ncbi:hypothetical protein [Lacticaseibacillus thailandensis]|uniref:hypothetical protein n=1 Tax=Lacticaseibacillus thailandensis TaxID=381741 RepID=UPI0021E8CDFC|nr:hypothetical protein [Lacticaseibacillus thailandensis]
MGIDLVGFDQHLTNVIASLIGTLIVVDNLDNAVPIANSLHHRYRLVTSTGISLMLVVRCQVGRNTGGVVRR